MTQRRPKFLYFDMGKVLLGFSHAHACEQVAKVANVPLERVQQFFTPERSLNRLECGAVSSRELYEDFCDTFDCRPDFDELTWAGSDIFCLNAEMVPLVAQLAAANLRMGLLSNTCDAHWEFVSRGRYRILSDFFEVAALSFEIGAMKPAPKIYAAATQLAGVDPADIFFTDDRAENVSGARDAGWSAVQYSSAPQVAAELRERGLKFNY